MMNKRQRDQLIIQHLTRFKILSRNQIAKLIFSNNSNPVNVCNRVMKRLSMDGFVLPVPQTKDQPYLYTANPSPIHHKSNKIDHALKIVDFYIAVGQPETFIIEPIFGGYEPDVYFTSKEVSYCVEIQLTPISHKKMQQKVNQFVSEFGVTHNSKIIVICTNQNYSKISAPNSFKIIHQKLP